ncbi:anthranilate phosphoribosyltransferase [Actinocatenispora rupis]|uniref:Anthranilate phosphoribosyltransferase n=1 Tax=Actinocatenispora rupis TaxID=519421 RepID=A0A8J3NF84_9ACTN|nr:anthranilate phosphoribosyltransferase [Actinocatenispora rupis]GID13469.1 anthranilate phosphoribosyltransferase 1 [Actinocatenispora rupis]
MADRTWSVLLSTLLRGESLAVEDTAWAMDEIMAGNATGAQIGAFAVALRAKGETPAEVAAIAEVMLAHTTRPDVARVDGLADAADVVGTGGDGAHTVNISTMAAIVVAGAGVPVVKHGNRAASSRCGAADLLEALGVPLELGPDDVARCVREAGIGFCFAARFHPGYRHVGAPRREIGVPTVFNFLGPLTNPATPRAGAIGCADLRMAPVLAAVLAKRGCSALVLRGEDGLDEFTTTAPTRMWVVSGGDVREIVLHAGDLGMAPATAADLRGADAAYNSAVARRVLAGESGPVRDAVLINAAAAIAAYRGLDGDVTAALAEGVEAATTAIDSGAAAATLATWVDVATR